MKLSSLRETFYLMNPIWETLAVSLIAVLSAALGWFFGRQTGWKWTFGWLLPLSVQILIAVCLNVRQLCFVPPTSWLMEGLREWVFMAMAIPMILGTLAGKLKTSSQRKMLYALSLVCALRIGILPFLAPLIDHQELETLRTDIDGDGVCMQTTRYTCGPASAVTALRKLGFPCEEGALGLLCQTSSTTGTQDDIMTTALRDTFGPKGLYIEHRYVKSARELADWPVSIVVIKHGFMVDHYVTVLKVDANTVTVGDPLIGEQMLPIEQFEKTWRNVAILMRRTF